MSGLFGSVQYLTTHMGHESLRSANSIKQIAASGDPVKQASMQGQGAGGVSFAANLLNGTASKRSSVNAFQNAMTRMQMQAEGLRQAEKIYQQMIDLASLAVDPMISDDERSLLNQQFVTLRNTAVEINSQDLAGADLFDMRAATTQYQVSFLEGTKQDPSLKSGEINGNDYYDVTKDVIYTSGKLTIDHRPMGAWDRVMVFQNDPSKPLFDTGQWTTSQTDFDRFIIRYGPDRDTTFEFVPVSANFTKSFPPSWAPDPPVFDTEDNIFANKGHYIGHFGVSDDGSSSGWESRVGQEFKNLGIVSTNRADPSTSELTVRIEATGNVFHTKAIWEPLEMEDSVVGRSQDLQVGLNPVGLGALREQEDGFPKIAIDTRENALKAIASIGNEIEGMTQQLGNLSSNMTRVDLAMDTAQKQMATREEVLSGVLREDLSLGMLKITKDRISRSQNAAMLTQAINLNYDVVNMII